MSTYQIQNKPLKQTVFLPYWVERQVQQGALSQQPLCDPQVLRTLSQEDLLCIHCLTDVMSVMLGIVKMPEYLSQPHFINTAGWIPEGFIRYETAEAYYINALGLVRSSLLDANAPRVKPNLSMVNIKGEEYDGYTVRVGADDRIYITVYPGMFNESEEGAARMARLRKHLVQLHLNYSDYDTVARSQLYERYFDTL